MKRLIEINQYEHKGVKVIIRINHLTGKIDIVEGVDQGEGKTIFKDKQWVFCHRGLDYMVGWQTILDAIKYAIGEATKLLEHDLAEESKFKEDMVMKVLAAEKQSKKTK